MNKTELGSKTAKGGFANEKAICINDMNCSISKYKKCKCPDDCFEVIVIDHDENFDDRSTIYYHCMNCGTDFAIVDFYTMETLYQNI